MLDPSIDDPDLAVEPLGAPDLTFVTARDHPVAHTRAAWHELVAHRWFLLARHRRRSLGRAAHIVAEELTRGAATLIRQ